MSLRSVLEVFEQHKEAVVAIAALLSPFAAVWAALIASKRASRAALEAARIQTRANVVTAYQQRLIDQLREEMAAEIAYISYLRALRQVSPPRQQELSDSVKAAIARKTRIALLCRLDSPEAKEFFSFAEKLINTAAAAPNEERWPNEANATFDEGLNILGAIAIRLLKSELELAHSSKSAVS